MRTLVIGMGEVGRAHYDLLNKSMEGIYSRDIKVDDSLLPEQFDLLIICIRYTDDFIDIVKNYEIRYKAKFINVCTTVPVGTCEKLGVNYVHSTTRGIHPNLEEGLLQIPKHIGGEYSELIANFFRKAGINCITHLRSRTTELAHILNNCAYGVNLMLADELQKICRNYGVDYFEAVMLYTHTNNIGFVNLDNASKVRMILTPPNKKIGGHCVTMSANLIEPEKRTEMIDKLANYKEGE